MSSATGRGIAGARLVLEHAGTTTEVACDGSGAFRFTPKAGATYTLVLVTADGHFPFAPAWDASPIVWTARPGARVSGFVIALEPAARRRRRQARRRLLHPRRGAARVLRVRRPIPRALRALCNE